MTVTLLLPNKYGPSWLAYLMQYKNWQYVAAMIIQSYGEQEAIEHFKEWNPSLYNPFDPTHPGRYEVSADLISPTGTRHQEYLDYQKGARLEYYKLIGHPTWAN